MRRWLGPADALLQQATWWTAALCAARGRTALAALAGAAAVAAHLLARPGERVRLGRVLVAAAAYGFATDTLLAASGLVAFAGAGPVSPAWMVGLWAAFGAGLTASLAGVSRWPAPALLAAAAAAGPLAYRAGTALGAISFGDRPGAAALAIALQWALGVPLLASASRAPAPESLAAVGKRRPAASAGACR